jgi:signal recognition particle receptor subunit beta
MVFFNYATMQMAAKIVYYGPGLCGKTTNLHHIYAKTSPQSRGEMVSLETETDRTLFFDLLPIDVGVIGGFKTRLQLYTIPGQVFYNTTRKLVLKGVDGIVFVADSQPAALDGNADSLKNLRENLAEIGISLDELPLVLQLNKRDLPNVTSIETMLDMLDPDRTHEYVEAVAASGTGVFETLKVISKLTLRTLRRRMTGEEPMKPGPRKLADVAQFRVKNQGSREPQVPASAASSAKQSRTAVEEAPAEDHIAEIIAAATTADEPPVEVTAPEPPAPEPEVDFTEAEKPAKVAKVKHVKVRSTIDVMAELEALRKRATTQAAPKSKKEPAARRGREVQKDMTVSIPADVLAQTKTVKVTLSFENTDGGVAHEQKQTLELEDTANVDSVSVNLRIEEK